MEGDDQQNTSVQASTTYSGGKSISRWYGLVAGLLAFFVAIVVILYFFLFPLPNESSVPDIVDIDTSRVSSDISAGTNNKTQDLPDTNPFKASKNPFDEYKNPFDN